MTAVESRSRSSARISTLSCGPTSASWSACPLRRHTTSLPVRATEGLNPGVLLGRSFHRERQLPPSLLPITLKTTTARPPTTTTTPKTISAFRMRHSPCSIACSMSDVTQTCPIAELEASPESGDWQLNHGFTPNRMMSFGPPPDDRRHQRRTMRLDQARHPAAHRHHRPRGIVGRLPAGAGDVPSASRGSSEGWTHRVSTAPNRSTESPWRRPRSLTVSDSCDNLSMTVRRMQAPARITSARFG